MAGWVRTAHESLEIDKPPPGMIKASHRFSSSGVRTWITSRWPFPETFCSITWCSANAPCNATIRIHVNRQSSTPSGNRVGCCVLTKNTDDNIRGELSILHLGLVVLWSSGALVKKIGSFPRAARGGATDAGGKEGFGTARFRGNFEIIIFTRDP